MKKLQSLYDKPWKQLLISAVAFGLSYAAASWAIDTARLSAYFLAIILLVLGIKHLIQAIKQGYDRKS
jgi:uncharacterized membrane protein HdeD (DUF308 family)